MKYVNTLEYILKKFNLEFNENTRLPIEIRDFDRETMATLFKELGFKVGVEVGVRGGGYSMVLCRDIPGLKLYGIDPYEVHEGYLDHTLQSSLDNFEKEAREKLAPYPTYEFIKKYSMDAVKDFENESLDFVYIDGDHSFETVTEDISKWGKKVRKGGIISGDDYFDHKGPSRIHVYQVIRGYTDAYRIKPWFVVGSKDIVPGEKRDHGRSWFFVKQ